MDAVHVPYFGAIAVLFFFSLRLDDTLRLRRILMAAVAAIAWAGAVEVIQPYTGRSESTIDFRNGAIGILLASLALWTPRRRPIIAVAAIGACVYAAWPAWGELHGILWRHVHFPVLGEFESDAELHLWVAPETPEGQLANTQIERTTEFASSGAHSLRVTGTGTGYPGVRFLAGDQDWRRYTMLGFDLYNPGAPFELGLRIDDADSTSRGDRYSASLPLTNGWNRIELPLATIAKAPANRSLRLEAVRRVVFFMDGKEARTFYLDHVRLE